MRTKNNKEKDQGEKGDLPMVVFIYYILGIVTLVLGLPMAIYHGLKALQNPGILIYFVGILLFITMGMSAFFLLNSEYKKNKFIQKLAICVLTIGIFIIGFWIGFHQQEKPLASFIPLQVAHDYNFENMQDITNITPWKPFPEINNHELLISTEKKYSHSGTNSLRLIVNLKPYSIDPKKEYGAIGATDLKLHDVKAIIAWILIPESEQVQNNILRSHIILYMHDQNDKSFGIYSKIRKIIPGIWTQIFLGLFDSAEFKDIKFGGNIIIDDIYLTVWSEQYYKGSIFIDDIIIYKNTEG